MIRKLGLHIPQIHPTAYIDPDATVIGWVEIGAHCFIGPGARIRGDNAKITIGDYSNVQDNAVIHVSPGFPVSIGQHVTVAHNTIIHGCTISDRVLVGMNCVIENGAFIHSDSILDAGVFLKPKWVVAEPLIVRNHSHQSYEAWHTKEHQPKEMSATVSSKHAGDNAYHICSRDFRIFSPREAQLKLILDNAQQYVNHCANYRAELETEARYLSRSNPLAAEKEPLLEAQLQVNAATAHLQLIQSQIAQGASRAAD